MRKKMPQILDCDVKKCAYNNEGHCCTLGITIGDGDCPACDTSFMTSEKGGYCGIHAGVGACKVNSCTHNDMFECMAKGIHVKMHENHAECMTFTAG